VKPCSEESVSTTPQYTLEQLDSRHPFMMWRVSSQSNPGKYYTCCLLENNCTCEHWMRRLWDKPIEQRVCKHLKVAREQALNLFIADIKKRY
jgi:hypothetical protein